MSKLVILPAAPRVDLLLIIDHPAGLFPAVDLLHGDTFPLEPHDLPGDDLVKVVIVAELALAAHAPGKDKTEIGQGEAV